MVSAPLFDVGGWGNGGPNGNYRPVYDANGNVVGYGTADDSVPPPPGMAPPPGMVPAEGGGFWNGQMGTPGGVPDASQNPFAMAGQVSAQVPAYPSQPPVPPTFKDGPSGGWNPAGGMFGGSPDYGQPFDPAANTPGPFAANPDLFSRYFANVWAQHAARQAPPPAAGGYDPVSGQGGPPPAPPAATGGFATPGDLFDATLALRRDGPSGPGAGTAGRAPMTPMRRRR